MLFRSIRTHSAFATPDLRAHPIQAPPPSFPQPSLRQLYTLLVDMGNTFKVLIQRKGIGRIPLSGLQFTQQLA